MSSIFCVTSLLRCNCGTLFVLPIGDGCDMHSVLSITYLTLFLHLRCVVEISLSFQLSDFSTLFIIN
jgi:hypothetical protein